MFQNKSLTFVVQNMTPKYTWSEGDQPQIILEFLGVFPMPIFSMKR